MRTSQDRPSTYGIHFVKVVTICHQVMVHAQAWLTNAYTKPIDVAPSYLALRTMLLTGAISMAVPMTATAILRLNFQHSPLNRIQRFSWQPYLGLCAGLMLLESCKQAFVYGRGAFFEWDALHTIAVTFILVLAVAQYSILWLWPLALSLIFASPYLIRFLKPYEQSLMAAHPNTAPFDANIVGQAFAVVFMIAWAVIFYRILAANLSERIKIRLAVANIVFGIVGVACCELSQNQWGDEVVLRLLPIGSLIGTYSGQHIWGLFPWAGVTILGFLIYDLMIRKTCYRWLGLIAGTGALFIAIFYWRFGQQSIDRCTPHGKFTGFGGVCFNRTPGQIFLIVGCFLLLVVAGRFVEKWGWENRSIRAVSRSILWIYLFATTLLPSIAEWWTQHIPAEHLIWSFVVFSLVCSYLLAMIIDHLPLQLSVTLRKVESPA